VEIADLGEDGVLVRDSKDPTRTLRFDRREWTAFIQAVKTGHLRQPS
jgi:hypothetical protein